MLRREHALARFDFAAGRLVPDRLTVRRHRRYLDHAARMLDIYRRGDGRTRRELHRAVREVFADEVNCPVRRIEAFCKLLDDAAQYRPRDANAATALRHDVFRAAAPLHPLVERPERPGESSVREAWRTIARRFGRSWLELQRELFGDVIDQQRLEAFAGFSDPRALLSRYNVAQVQAALFDAVSMTVRASGDFKTILRYAKLARLMHTISREEDGAYRFQLAGPASVLRRTTRYGVSLAKFLPSLIACRDWSMQAAIERGRGRLTLDLSSTDGFTSSHLPPAEFDSSVEEKFARKWGAGPREGWILAREGEVLVAGQMTFVPDFVFRHGDGRRVLLEIVGFWTPEYLTAKVETLRHFGTVPILLAAPERHAAVLSSLSHEVIRFKSALKVGDVLAALVGR
jgi:predicted nuclease of restriction endonuclease-like RecB superfamily